MSKKPVITVCPDHDEWIVKNQNGTTLRRCSGKEQALAFAEQHRQKGKDVHLLDSERKTVLPGITPRRIALEKVEYAPHHNACSVRRQTILKECQEDKLIARQVNPSDGPNTDWKYKAPQNFPELMEILKPLEQRGYLVSADCDFYPKGKHGNLAVDVIMITTKPVKKKDRPVRWHLFYQEDYYAYPELF